MGKYHATVTPTGRRVRTEAEIYYNRLTVNDGLCASALMQLRFWAAKCIRVLQNAACTLLAISAARWCVREATMMMMIMSMMIEFAHTTCCWSLQGALEMVC